MFKRVNEKPYVQGQGDTMFKRVNEKPYVQGQDDTMFKSVNEKPYVQGQDDTMFKRNRTKVKQNNDLQNITQKTKDRATRRVFN
jgi:hypothetical protein